MKHIIETLPAVYSWDSNSMVIHEHGALTSVYDNVWQLTELPTVTHGQHLEFNGIPGRMEHGQFVKTRLLTEHIVSRSLVTGDWDAHA